MSRKVLHRLVLAALLAPGLAACAGPLPNLGALFDPAGAERRGAVELAVKQRHAQIMAEIAAGGGPALTEALDAARVPGADRAARRLQLQGDIGLYQANPGALVATLLVWGA